MNTRLSRILSRMMGNSSAILRFHEEDNVETKLVEMTDHRQDTVICCLREGEILPPHNKTVSLIIKNNQHYFHCHGEVMRSFLNGRVFTIELMKASLFVRKRSDDASWMEQLYEYAAAGKP